MDVGTTIRELRKWLRISQTAVAEFLEIPRTAVSSIETNKREVSVDELMKLSDLLRCDPNSLLGLTPTPVTKASSINFKARTNQPDCDLDPLDWKELQNFSAALRTMAAEGRGPHAMAPNSLIESFLPYKAADELAVKLGLQPPVDIYTTIIQVGLYPRFSALSGLAGALVREEVNGRQVFGILINSDQSEERMRFSAAHELAHYILGHAEDKTVVPSPKARWKDPIESDADSFASELLVPKRALREHLEKFEGRTLSALDVLAIADEFMVSYSAMCVRLADLGFISKVQFGSFLNEKPSELRTRMSSRKVKQKKFDVNRLPELIRGSGSDNFRSTFYRSPDWVRWLQEVAYQDYWKSTRFDEREAEIKDIYEAVALWVAKNHPLTTEIVNESRSSIGSFEL